MNDSVKSVLSSFVFYYPFFMSYFWIVGGLLHFFLFEQGRKHRATLLPRVPRVTIVVPCYNEGENVAEVIAHLDRMHYPNYRIIAVNDGSRDNTGTLLNELAEQYPRLLVVHQSRNEGKAIGLNTAAQLSDAEFLLCIDGDSLPHPDSITYMLTHFLHAGHVGAVTGNPRIRNRSTVLGRMQVGEFSSIVGLIKRTQQLYGKLMTVSGVMTMFRKQALHQVGYWSPDMQTEDIDISWKLQLAGWTLRYEPRALTWILMPETFRGLFKQRLPLGARRHRDRAEVRPAHAQPAPDPDVADLPGVQPERAMGLRHAVPDLHGRAGPVRGAAARLAVRDIPALARHAAVPDLPGAVVRRLHRRPRLRLPHLPLLRRCRLVSDRVLDHRHGHHRLRAAARPVSPSPKPGAVGKPRPRNQT